MPSLPFRSTSRRLKEQLEEQQVVSRQRDEENRRREADLANQLRKFEKIEYQRAERERQWEEQQQKARAAEEMRLKQEELALRERENQRLERLRKTSPEALRRLRELIRTRYQLDIYIWELRGVQKVNHDIVIREGKKADAILQEIYNIIDTWEESGWSREEWRVAKKIKDHLSTCDQRIWENNPPWNDNALRENWS